MDDEYFSSWMNYGSKVTRRISFQLISLLSVALLPVGAISISQSLSFAREVRLSAESLLLSLTADSVAVDHRQIKSGFTAAAGLADAVIARHDEPLACSKLLADFIESQTLFTFAGFVEPDGRMRCVSNGPDQDFAGLPEFRRISRSPGQSVDRIVLRSHDGASALVVTQPVLESGKVLGASWSKIAAPVAI